MSEFHWAEPTDLVDGRRTLRLSLHDKDGKLLASKFVSFGGNDRCAEEHGVSVKAKELYRDAFMVLVCAK